MLINRFRALSKYKQPNMLIYESKLLGFNRQPYFRFFTLFLTNKQLRSLLLTLAFSRGEKISLYLYKFKFSNLEIAGNN